MADKRLTRAFSVPVGRCHCLKWQNLLYIVQGVREELVHTTQGNVTLVATDHRTSPRLATPAAVTCDGREPTNGVVTPTVHVTWPGPWQHFVVPSLVALLNQRSSFKADDY